MDKRDRGRPTIYDEVTDTALATSAAPTPWISYEKDGTTHRIDADFVIGCDGPFGASRGKVPPEGDRHLRARLSLRLARPPRRGAARPPRAHLRQAHARFRPARCAPTPCPATTCRCRLPTTSRTGPTTASGTSSAAACPARMAGAVVTGPSFENDRAALALLRRRADAPRPALPRRRRRPHRAADRGQGPEPRGGRRPLPLRRPPRAHAQGRRRPRRLSPRRALRGSGGARTSPGG